MKYTWNIYTLEDRLEQLHNLLKLAKTKEEKIQIVKAIKYLKNEIGCFKEEPENDEKLLDKLDKKAIYLSKYQFLFGDLQDFDYFHRPKKEDYELLGKVSLPRKYFSMDDAINFTRDFYFDLNKDIYLTFKQLYNERYSHLKRGNDSYTIEIPVLNEVFTEVEHSDDINTLLCYVHEYMHAIHFLHNPSYSLQTGNTVVRETDTLLAELLAADYYDKTIKGNDGIIFQALNDETLHTHTRYLLDLIKLVNLHRQNHFTSNSSLKRMAFNKFGFSGLYVNDLIDNSYEKDLPYIESYMFAVELYSTFQKDKEKGLFTLNKFIMSDEQTRADNYEFMKRKLQLIPNMSMGDYQSEVMRLVRKTGTK